MVLRLRALTEEEAQTIKKWSGSRTVEARLVERARIIRRASEGESVPQIATAEQTSQNTVRKWLKRFEHQGLAGLQDEARSGAPPRYTAGVKALVVAAALTNPQDVGLPFGSWTYERLNQYIREELHLHMKKTRMFEILQEEGLRWRHQESCFGERVDPDFAKTRGQSKP